MRPPPIVRAISTPLISGLSIQSAALHFLPRFRLWPNDFSNIPIFAIFFSSRTVPPISLIRIAEFSFSRKVVRRSPDFLSADGEKRSLSKRRARSPKTQPLRAARAAPFPPPDHRSLSGFSSTFTIRDAILLRSPHSSTCATYTVRGKSGGNGSAPDLKNTPLPPWSGFVAGCRRGWRARGTPANPSQKITVPPRGARKSCATSVRERSLLRGISSLFLRSLRRWPQGRPRSSFQCG